VTLRLGILVKRQRTCPACGGIEQYRLEKGVDVMLAIEMVSGAVEDKYDVAYLLALDADYSPTVRYVRERGKKVFLVAPKGSPYGTLGRVCNVTIPIDQATVTECQAE